MASVSYQTFISVQHLQDIGYCMIALATSFTIARFTIRGIKRRFWPPEDAAVFLAWACVVALCSGYIVVTPAVYRIAAVGSGKAAPYPTLKQDATFLVDIFFPNTLLLWCCLWLVKAALLMQCRRLIERQRRYMIVWWCIVAFTATVFVGCVITEFTSCRTLHDWFTFGQCSTPRDARASIISLYYAFAVDIVTDFMIMAFPVKVLWALKLSRTRKLSIMAIFCVGIMCMCFSVVRVVQIGSASGTRQPSPSWLEVWAMVEGAVAVVVACLPTFGLFFPSIPSRTGYARSGAKSNPKIHSQSRTGQEDGKLHNGIALRDRFAREEDDDDEGKIRSESLHEARFDFSPSDGKTATTTVEIEDSPSRKTSSSEQQLV